MSEIKQDIIENHDFFIYFSYIRTSWSKTVADFDNLQIPGLAKGVYRWIL